MIRIFTFLFALLWGLTGYAATKKKYPGGKMYMYRITLTDKHDSPYSLDHPTRWLSAKSVERRQRQGLELDSTDLPITPRYLDTISAVKGVNIVGQSRWNNTVVTHLTDTLVLQRLRQLPFVTKAELVWVSPDSIEKELPRWNVHRRYNPWDSVKNEPYGFGKEQIEDLKGESLHTINLRGQGMTIAIFDGGFQNVNRISAFSKTHIEGTHNFVWNNPQNQRNDGDDVIYNGADHGTRVLSAMAAYSPKVLIGTAPEARYWLLRCEDQLTEQPVEEDYWTMAAEFADSAGVDIINSSLGYNDYDAPHRKLQLKDLDGQSTLISRTASMLASKGIILVNSAGNTGMGPWKKICVPADAREILTVGALNTHGANAPFSSVGPSQDGRVKPDVMAIGSPAVLISGRGSVVRDMGTSFSTPVICGLVACLWQALPNMRAIDIINLIRKSSDNYHTPNNIYGYGKPNFWQAYRIGKGEVKSE